MEKVCGIYCIENTTNGNKYIGQSKHIAKRLSAHKRSLKSKIHYNIHLQRSYNIYGETCFSFYILEKCDFSELDKKERFWIEKEKSNDRLYGYNIEKGGKAKPEMEIETKQKMSKSARAKAPMTIEHKQHIKEAMREYGKTLKGIPKSETVKQKFKDCHADFTGDKHPRFAQKSKKSSSVYLGVSWCKSISYWMVYVYVNKKQIYLGSNKDEKTAARIFDKYVYDNNLSYPLNFPENYGGINDN